MAGSREAQWSAAKSIISRPQRYRHFWERFDTCCWQTRSSSPQLRAFGHTRNTNKCSSQTASLRRYECGEGACSISQHQAFRNFPPLAIGVVQGFTATLPSCGRMIGCRPAGSKAQQLVRASSGWLSLSFNCTTFGYLSGSLLPRQHLIPWSAVQLQVAVSCSNKYTTSPRAPASVSLSNLTLHQTCSSLTARSLNIFDPCKQS